jgi:hypothetical protein
MLCKEGEGVEWSIDIKKGKKEGRGLRVFQYGVTLFRHGH